MEIARGSYKDTLSWRFHY